MQKDILVQYLVTIVVSLATFTMGVTSGWATPVLLKFSKNETNVEINDDQVAWMLSMAPPGFVIGSLCTRFLCDAFGRRTTFLASALPIGCGMIIVASANTAWLLIVTRLLWGAGTGMISTVITLYLAEIADKNIRASLSVVTRVAFNLGMSVTISVGPFLSYELLNYVILVLPISFFFACLWIPESPYYLLKEGKVNGARKVLLRLRQNAEIADAELEIMKADVKKDMARSSTARELFGGRQYRKAIIISAGLKVANILTGVLTIQQYLGVIIHESNSNMSESTALIIFGVVIFVVGIMSSAVADRVGRRPLLICSFLGTGFSLSIVALYFFLQKVVNIDNKVLGIFGFVPLAGIIISNVISTFGFNSIIGIIPAEVFPLNVRTVAMTSLNIFGGFLGFAVNKGYKAVKDLMGMYGVFFTFAVISICGAVFSYLAVPETKGKTLQEIQLILQGKDVRDIQETIKLEEVKREDKDTETADNEHSKA